METNFELKNVTKTSTSDNLSEYTLNFENNNEEKTIVLTGLGKLKDIVNV